MWVQFDPDRCMGGSRPNENDFFFIARSYALSAVHAVGRCLSVCLSVTFMFCIQTAKDVVKLLSRPEADSPLILVF